MSASSPVSYQYRSFDQTFVLKPHNDQLSVKVYDKSQQCLLKRTFYLDELFAAFSSESKEEQDANEQIKATAVKIPEGIQNVLMLLEANRADLSSLLQLIDQKGLFAFPPSTSEVSCRHAIKKAIVEYQSTVRADDRKELEEVRCPITLEVFREPVMDEYGHSFEKSAIDAQLESGDNRCPIDRRPISLLTPNRELKALIESLTQVDPIPTFSLFQSENPRLLEVSLTSAREFVAQRRYSDALENYSRAFRYTKDWRHYVEIVTLFNRTREPERALLASLYLALYQVTDCHVEEAIKTLESCDRSEYRAIESLLIRLYYLNKEPRKALELVKTAAAELPRAVPAAVAAAAAAPASARRLISLYKQVLAEDPKLLDFYEPLAKLVEDPEEKTHLLLKGACHAMECENLARAAHFCSLEKTEGPFINQLVLLNLLKTQQRPSLLIKRIKFLAEEYKQLGQFVQALQAYKLLFQLDPRSVYYRELKAMYEKLGKQDKMAKWEVYWTSQTVLQRLQESRSGLHEERMGLGEEEFFSSRSSSIPGAASRKSELEEFIKTLEFERAVPTPSRSPSIPDIAFGKAQWEEFFGKIDEVPSLPADIHSILESDCPFFPGKKVRETHILVLIPDQVGEKPLNLPMFNELCKNSAKEIKVENLHPRVAHLHQQIKPIERSHWGLMTRATLPKSEEVFAKIKSKQERALKEFFKEIQHRTKKTYHPPTLLEAIICIYSEYFRSGTKLFPDSYIGFIENFSARAIVIAGAFQDQLNILGNPGHSAGVPAMLKL